MRLIRDKKKNVLKEGYDTIEQEKKRVLVDQARKVVSLLIREKALKERQFQKDFNELEDQIKRTTYEIKLLSVQEKDKDNQLKLLYMREREIEKSIADYKKL